MIEVTQNVSLNFENLRNQAIGQLPPEVQGALLEIQDLGIKSGVKARYIEQKVSQYLNLQHLLLGHPERTGQQTVLKTSTGITSRIRIRSRELIPSNKPEIEVIFWPEYMAFLIGQRLKNIGKDEIIVVHHTRNGERVTLSDMV